MYLHVIKLNYPFYTILKVYTHAHLFFIAWVQSYLDLFFIVMCSIKLRESKMFFLSPTN